MKVVSEFVDWVGNARLESCGYGGVYLRSAKLFKMAGVIQNIASEGILHRLPPYIVG